MEAAAVALTSELASRALSRPAHGLLHPVAFLALALLVVNDHVLKAVWPGFVTGKLSDVAGLVVAPLALQGAWELGQWIAGRWAGPSSRVLAVAMIIVGVAFVSVQVWAPATDLYRWGLGAAQWSLHALASFVAGTPPPNAVPVDMTADAEDLLALPALAVTWWVGRRRQVSAA